MNKLEYVTRSLSRGTNKKYETYVINAIYQKINNPNLVIETQKEIKLENGYHPLIDLFLPQLNIAIEVDEGYHQNEHQKEHDIWRENVINQKINQYCSADHIHFIRISVTSSDTLEEVNARIDEAANFIKDRISNIRLHWVTDDEIREKIRKRGSIRANDCFATNYDVINEVYGKHLKGWRRAGYKLLWFPVISDRVHEENGVKLSSRATWQNWYDGTGTIIYERSTDKRVNSDKKKRAINNFDDIRIVFAKDRDSFGKRIQRFVGVVRSDGWDDVRDAQIWRIILKEIKIPLTEEYIEKIKNI